MVFILVECVSMLFKQVALYGRSATSLYSGLPLKGCSKTQKKYVKTPAVAVPEPCWSVRKIKKVSS